VGQHEFTVECKRTINDFSRVSYAFGISPVNNTLSGTFDVLIDSNGVPDFRINGVDTTKVWHTSGDLDCFEGCSLFIGSYSTDSKGLPFTGGIWP
jgi:hypothetical protein